MKNKHHNLTMRLIGAPIFLAIVFALFYWDMKTTSTVAVTSLIILVGYGSIREFYGLCQRAQFHPAMYSGIVCALLFVMPPSIKWYGNEMVYYVPSIDILMFFFLYIMIKMVLTKNTFTPVDAALTIMGVLYVGMFRYAFIFYHSGTMIASGSVVLLYLFITAKGSDMFAFVFGKMIGRHKLIPRVSPGKTVEGAIAGIIGGVLFGCLLLYSFGTMEWTIWNMFQLIIISICLTILSQIGDLVESLCKRWAGVKDSGSLFPAFGGMLDLVDNFFVTLPAAYLLFAIAGWLR